jgi:LacI family transcriptional regulator
MVVSAVEDPFMAQLVGVVEVGLRDAGFITIVAQMHDNRAEELQVVKGLTRLPLDGLLITALRTHQTSETLQLLESKALPVVLVDRCASDVFDQVGTENRRAVANLVNHLVKEHNLTRIGLIYSRLDIATTDERLAGYVEGLRESGLNVRDQMMRCGDSTAQGAERAMLELLNIRPRVQAVIAGNGLMARGALSLARRQGIRIPEEMAVVSFDDTPWFDHLAEPLTTMAQPITEIGNAAVRLLLDRIERPDKPPRKLRLAPAFITRQSCGCRRG